MSADASHLLNDVEVVNFIVTGYHLVELDIPDDVNALIAAQLDALGHNPGDAILEEVPELWQVVEHPATQGVLASLLGNDFEVRSHRHWHCKQPGSSFMQWHQDSTNNRDLRINRFLGLYYPTDITPDMGPTIIVPGTQYRNAPTDRMAHYTNIKGQIPLTVKAGTIAFTHYDLWHGTAANRSNVKRHMIKFLFGRTKNNTAPTWSHDPECMDRPRDWDLKGQSEDPGNILAFSNLIGVSQSDHYKERKIRRQAWDYLCGEGDLIEAGEG
jgi:hypothetical protein